MYISIHTCLQLPKYRHIHIFLRPFLHKCEHSIHTIQTDLEFFHLTLTLLLTSCVTLGELLNFSVPPFL